MTLYTIIKQKSNVKGFWKDEKGKVYIDNVKQIPYSKEAKEKLFSIGELAVFYTEKGKAFIENKAGGLTILNQKIVEHRKRLRPSYIKELLSIYGGLTVYRNKIFNDYTIEIFK